MRKLVTILILLAFSLFAYSNYFPSRTAPEPLSTNTSELPLSWPPRAEDGRRESIISALTVYFQTLFSADEIIEEAKSVADKAAQRQQDIEQTIDNSR